ncbi:hypothetical protein Vi05172_g7128 [Venturia inaequalis]|nr:hypothetical protein Vi05172_g7128 [Venturia inaequalis]
MKVLYLLLVSLLTTSVSARRHRLCCCAGFNACNQFVCDAVGTQAVVDAFPKRYVRSTKSWDKDTGSPCGGLKNWMYATNDRYDVGEYEDGYLGGKEVSNLCFFVGLSSRCFNAADYKNFGKIKERSYPTYPNSKRHSHPVVGGGKR